MRTRKEEPTMVKWMRPILIGTIFGMLLCMAVLLVFAMIMAAQDIPQMAVTPLAVIAAAAGSFLGGMISARVAGSRGLMFGAACGALLYTLVMIMGFAMLQDIRGWYAIIKLLIMVACAAMGGVFGVNSRRRKR